MKDTFGKLTVFAAILALVFAAGCGGAARPSASSFGDDPQAEGEAWEDSELEEAEAAGGSVWEEDAAAEGEFASMGEEPQEGVEAIVSGGGSAYTVLRGDNLWNISSKREIYADPWEWPIIYHANESRIENPNLIKKNWVLGIPRDIDAAVIQDAKEEARAAVYTVPGSRIADGDEFGFGDEFASAEEMDDVAAVGALDTKRPKKSKPKKGAAAMGGTIIAIILLVLLIGAGVLYYLKKQKEKASLGVNQVEQAT